MIGAALGALMSFWRARPLQLFTLLAGLALATALWSGVQAINAEARASYAAASATLGGDSLERIVDRAGGTLAQADYIALRRGGWLVSPVVEGRLNGVRLAGIDPLTAPQGPTEAGAGDLWGFIGGRGQIIGRADTLRNLPQEGPELVEQQSMAPGLAIADIGQAQRLLGLEGRISYLVVLPGQPLRQVPLAEIAPGLELTAARPATDLARLTDSFHLNLTAFGLLAFAVGIFIVHGAVGLAFEQRRALVRTLRALGLPLGALIGLLAGELLVLSLLAGGMGVALGYLIAAALLPDVAATLRGLYGADLTGQLQIRPVWWLSGLGMAVGGAALASAGALWRLARLPILAGGQRRAWALAGQRALRRQFALAIGLLGLAAILALRGSGLLAGFGLLAALMLGAALLLPVVLGWLLRGCERLASAPVAQWFWADSRQQLPGLSLALMALLLAMAANTGVSTMVSSFRLTFAGFLDQRLMAELYVDAATPAEADRVRDYVTPRVDAVLPLMAAQTMLAGGPGELRGMVDHASFRDNWQFLAAMPDAWDRLHSGRGVMVSEQLARRADLWLGDVLGVEGTALPVVAVVGDYGNPVGQAIVTASLFASLHPEAPPHRLALRLPPGEVPGLVDALVRDLGISRDRLTDQAALKAYSMGVFERTFAVTGALNLLTLAVAGFAMLMSLLTLATLRLPQLAPVWALGLTRARLGRLELLRAVLLAGLVTLLAVPLGLALAWVLLAVVNVEAFGWRLPMHLFPADYARLAGLALVAAALAAWWPARRLARTRPADLLRVFANER